jgi:5'-deoxynucleotidase YfbR-like HD superfamily hydrolase
VARTPSIRPTAVRSRKIAEPRAWQRMLSGRRLDLLDPSPFDIEIEDIAHGLARVARWNGQTVGDHAFSVAQHSFVVEEIAAHIRPGLAPRWRLAALLHDAPEYVIGDMISPFKAALGLDYHTFEARLEAAIHHRFGLPARVPAPIKALIKTADRACAFFEATQIAGFGHEESLRLFGAPPAGYALTIEPMAAALAQSRYLDRYNLLSEAAGYQPSAQAFNTE